MIPIHGPFGSWWVMMMTIMMRRRRGRRRLGWDLRVRACILEGVVSEADDLS
jgi:hypothetical protein